MLLLSYDLPERERKRNRLLALVNATSTQISDILGVHFPKYFKQLRYERDYSENLKPRKAVSREITFTPEGVDVLLSLIEKFGTANNKEKCTGNTPKHTCVSYWYTYTYWTSMKGGVHRDDWEKARKTCPEYFCGGSGSQVESSIKEAYLENVLRLLVRIAEQRHLTVQYNTQKRPS